MYCLSTCVALHRSGLKISNFTLLSQERGGIPSRKKFFAMSCTACTAREPARWLTHRAHHVRAQAIPTTTARKHKRVCPKVCPKKHSARSFLHYIYARIRARKKRGTCPRFRVTSSPQTIPIMIDKSSPVTNTNGIAVSPIINLINKHPSSLQSNYTKAS